MALALLTVLLSAISWAQRAAAGPAQGVGSGHNLCLASSQHHPRINGYHYYPVDLFAPATYHDIIHNPHLFTDEVLYNCSSGIEARDTIRRCPTVHSFCPLHQQNVLDAVNRTERWMFPSPNTPPYMLRIWEKLGNYGATVNVIIFGGSATLGADSTGCQCDPAIDSKCSRNNEFVRHHTDSAFEKRCRWSNAFVRWLRSVSYATINFKFRALSATSSKFLSQNLESTMNGEIFSEDDLVLIDYSMNDALSYSSIAKLADMELGVERLLRHILDLSLDTWPTIVLLETWPRNGNIAGDPKRFPGTISYSAVYSKYAEHYGLALWSYRDFLWSDYAYAQQKDYIETLRFPDHPKWIPHLHMADMFAAIVWREFQRCAQYNGSSKDPDISWKHPLPAPLSKVDDSIFCASDVPVILDVDANQLHRGAGSHPLVHTLPVGVTNSWRLLEERPGKAGWIDEFTEEDLEQRRQKSIIFEIPADRQREVIVNDRNVIVQLRYLRTYFNAGAIEVYICGERRVVESIPANDVSIGQNLDSYWSTKVSIVEVYTFLIKQANWPAACESVVGHPDATMQALGMNSSYLRFTHAQLSLGDPKVLRVRTPKQKVKITGVKVCVAPR